MTLPPKVCLFLIFLSLEMANGDPQPLVLINCFSGNMDLIVSQVRRSVVSVVQQYSHIRYFFFLHLVLH